MGAIRRYRFDSSHPVTRNPLDPRLDEIYRYWQGKRGGRAFPSRADIQPGEMGNLVRLLNLIAVLRDPLRFRHRLVGREQIEWLGRDAAGHYVDEEV